jgi:uncharacterized membrane protein YbhN (UPF0104 family)
MKKTFRHLRPVASIASVALFVYVLRRTGITTVLDSARALGGGFILLILLSGLRHALRTAAWHACIGPTSFRPGWFELFGLRLVGEALNGVTPAGPLLGESVKVWAASKCMLASSSASSVVIENIIYGLGAGLFMLSGAVLLLVSTSRVRLGVWTVVTGLVASVFLAWAILRQRSPLIACLLDRLPATSRLKRFLDPYEARIKAVEAEVYDFFLTRRAAFIGILSLEFLTNFTGVAEVYLILRVTTALHFSLMTAYLVEVANRAVQLFFAFVPFGLGVEEGAAAGTLNALGYGASQGVSVAILRRARTVFWATLGLLLAARYCLVRPVEEGSAV